MPSKNGPNWTGSKLFTYLRYDPVVTEAGLRGLGRIDPAVVQVLDSVEHIADIQRVGATYAAKTSVREHFLGF